jgi:hypothetical protein
MKKLILLLLVFCLLLGTASANSAIELQQFINNSTIDQREYIPHSYNCVNFSNDLIDELNTNGFNASYAKLIESRPAEASPFTKTSAHIIVFVILENELVFVEPQTDKIMWYENITEYYNYTHILLDYEDSYVFNLDRPMPGWLEAVQ